LIDVLKPLKVTDELLDPLTDETMLAFGLRVKG